MDFFDNALDKARDAFDIACKKTEEVVNTQKQKFDIATIENKRNKKYEALGKLFFETVKDSEADDTEISALVSEIKEMNETVRRMRDEINIAKNKKECPKCKSVINSDASFCSNCGEKL